MLPKAHISASQINTYLRCPNQYMYRYIDGIILPPRSALTRGKTVHKAQEKNYSQKIDSMLDLPLDEVQSIAADEYELQATETEFEPDEDKGKIKDETISLASLYHTQIAPTVQPVLVEQEVKIGFEDGFSLLGYIDVVDSDGYIRDTKTTARTPSVDEADKSLQLTAYSLLYRELMGVDEAGVKLDYLVNLKTPKAVTLTGERDQEQINWFLDLMGKVVNSIGQGCFYPNPTNFMCSEKGCGYYQMCRRKTA